MEEVRIWIPLQEQMSENPGTINIRCVKQWEKVREKFHEVDTYVKSTY